MLTGDKFTIDVTRFHLVTIELNQKKNEIIIEHFWSHFQNVKLSDTVLFLYSDGNWLGIKYGIHLAL